MLRNSALLLRQRTCLRLHSQLRLNPTTINHGLIPKEAQFHVQFLKRMLSVNAQHLQKEPSSGKSAEAQTLEEEIRKIKEELKETEVKKEEVKSTQINIYQTNSDLVEGSKIKTFIKKKSIGMTDDESTATGKAKAKAKDGLSIGFIVAACGALGYTIYTLLDEWLAWKPEDHAYEIAKKVIENDPKLENSLGIDFTIATTDAKGNRSWGEKVQASAVSFDADLGLDMITVLLYASTKSRKCLVRAYLVKQEGEPDKKWFPMFIFGETDYDKKFYARTVQIVDNRADIHAKKDLETLRQKFWEDQELKDSAIAMLKKDDEDAKKQRENSASSLGALGGGSAFETKQSQAPALQTLTPDSSENDEVKRARPKW